MDRFEAQITDYAAGLRYEDLPPSAVHTAKERLLDSLAVACAAYHEPPARAMRQFALTATAARGATVFGTERRAPADYAAVYLGTLIRALDWNDTYLNREPAHPSDNIAACLAVAEAEGKTGRDLILAIVLAYELHCRLCDAAALRKKGWDHVTYGAIASAVPAARLLGLNKEQIRDAMSIAITTGACLRQTRIGAISQWKAAAFAQAAQNAVRAALYVKHGFTGPAEIFTGQHGFINQITRGEFDLAPRFGGQDGAPFKITDSYIKYFPAEYHSQSAIWAALALRAAIGPEHIGDIARIHIETSFHSWEIIGKEPAKWTPETRETADHSLPYITAAALLDGAITLAQFDEAHLRDRALLDLTRRVTVSEKKEYTDVYGKSFPNRLCVTLRDGRTLAREVFDPKGHPNNPLSRAEVEAKFRSASAAILSRGQQDGLLELIWSLENLEDAGALMRAVRIE